MFYQHKTSFISVTGVEKDVQEPKQDPNSILVLDFPSELPTYQLDKSTPEH